MMGVGYVRERDFCFRSADSPEPIKFKKRIEQIFAQRYAHASII